MRARLLGLLPVIVVTVALGRAADDWRPAVVVGVLAVVLAQVGPRWELDRGRQLVTCAMGAGAGYAVAALLYDDHAGSLSEGWTRIAAAAILAAAARFVVIRPRGGSMGTTALLFASLVAIGETSSAGYATFVVLFLLTSLAAMGASDERALMVGSAAPRITMAAAILVVAGAVAVVVAVGLRSAYAWIMSRAHPSAFEWRPRVGFSDRMDLGALDGLLDSDAIVLRVRGPRVDYLRGAALDVYVAGRWLRSDAAEVQTEATYNGYPSSRVVEIAAVGDRTDRFFLPLAAHIVATSPAAVLVDGVGAVRRAARHGVNVSRVVRADQDAVPPPPPRASDLQIPRAIRVHLESLASEWTQGENDAVGKLDAIQHRLRTGFHYARTFPRPGGTDPAIDFLFDRKSGHCEYFATAMTLVARAAGIPARAIMGYRVGEESPFGYYVVRERNAHAWVEAWVPGQGWTTRDPTPETELPQNRDHRSGYAASIADALSVGYDDLTDRLRRLTVQQTGVAWVVGFGVLSWIVARGARRRTVGTTHLRDDETGLPCLASLLASLKRSGHEWPSHEPLERFAARLPDRDAARLLERYAALRYGNIGDERTIAKDLRTYTPGPR
ncbi:MAG: DUF3488 and transglutaminase-like domain-containing protein [Myxococcota bacterium]|nr:DUF3488 and transglutaminase-like domain-containing protein [Myxococcota bacterium]